MPDPEIQKAIDEFDRARGLATNEYASLEQNLSMLFEYLTKFEPQKSGIVFSEYTSAMSRNRMLQRLIEIDYADRYRDFSEGLFKNIGGLDRTRNKIVHWIRLQSSTGGSKFRPKNDLFLAPNKNMFDGSKLKLHEIIDFTKRVEFFGQLVFYFSLNIKHPARDIGDPSRRPWSEVFQASPEYPPDEKHPLYR